MIKRLKIIIPIIRFVRPTINTHPVVIDNDFYIFKSKQCGNSGIIVPTGSLIATVNMAAFRSIKSCSYMSVMILVNTLETSGGGRVMSQCYEALGNNRSNMFVSLTLRLVYNWRWLAG